MTGEMSETGTVVTPRVGDWVEIKPLAEILSGLDHKGDLAGLPFMPEMAKYAGRRFRISAVAHKTCDTVNKTGGRSVKDAVHLDDLRCDGSAHGGCQATCLLFWKTDWLRPAVGPAAGTPSQASEDAMPATLQGNAMQVRGDGTQVFRCQATTLPQWTRPLHWWDARQYWRDIRSGNATPWRVVSTLLLAGVFQLRRIPVGYRVWNWIYGQAHTLLRGSPDPHGQGCIAVGAPTPDLRTGLAPGDLVQIKSKEEIYSTVNRQNRNRGLQVDEEMTRYCGGRFRVTGRVTQIINESTGEMMTFGNPCIVLDGVECLGEYSDRRLLCPRRITTYWREIWLTRIDESRADNGSS